ncbi:MAG: TetR/AcrR family transcriptional regulator [Alphaproteobacteria bacterium HGW-Alphaproteobacteria-12]|nr:MAG: TetR/AcrR family transcriptional regulator [Alphaproteobacteria bacterium HGW-Alphaproteobacteria-12]
MARRKEPQKLETIAEAAITCFSDLGVRRTQMTDVAKTAGMSAGALYLYVSSKEALFHLAILKLCARPLDTLALPLADPGMAETVAVFVTRAAEVRHWPSLDAASKPRAKVDREALLAIGRELYDMLHEARQAIWLVDRCAPEIPEFEELHARELRGLHRDKLAQIAMKAMDRKGAPSPALKLAARLAIEAVAWGAMHRMRESPANRIAGLSEENARETAVASFAATLTGTVV